MFYGVRFLRGVMSNIITSQATGNVVATLNRFAALVGTDDLSKRLIQVRKKLANQCLQTSAMLNRFEIPLGLMEFYGRGVSSPRNLNFSSNPRLYQAITFASTTIELARHMSSKAKKILVSRVLSALSPREDARPLAHEFRVAVALAHKGWDIEFVDFEGRGQFDFLGRRASDEIEVECKLVTGDLGNAVHREEFENFGNDLLKRISKQNRQLGSVRLDIALSDRMPKAFPEVQALISGALTVLDGNLAQLVVNGAKITRQQLDAMPLDPTNLRGSAFRVMEAIREERNGSVCGVFDETRFMVVHAYSERRSKVQDSILDAIEFGSSQFSRTRPSIIWTHFADLTNTELDSLIAIYREGTPTLLQGIAYKMFDSSKHDHVATLLFSGEAPITQHGGPDSLILHQPYFTQSGTLYPLYNNNCRVNQPLKELPF